MDRDDAECSLNEELEEKGTCDQCTPRIGEDPERDECNSCKCAENDTGPTSKFLGVEADDTTS